ncbi:MAG: 5'-3' exonuclease H3TH domain-containing protein [Nitriliruptoraceae bacterium]
MARLHLVDGTWELFRAHHSPRPSRTDPTGRDVKATVGVVESLLRLLGDRAESVTHLAVAFDNPIESFRNDLFAGYKDGSGVDPALTAQFDLVEQGVAALGITVWSLDEHEADDAIATAATTLAGSFDQIRILTPDKDLGQVVRGDHIVQVDRMRDREFDEQGVIERLGVPPRSVPDLLALVGDTADGIPGLPGFGAKGAAAVLRRWPHLHDIPTDVSDWDVTVRGAARLAATFADRRDDALLYRRLATLVRDVPLDLDPSALEWRGPTADVWATWCASMGASRLVDRPRGHH